MKRNLIIMAVYIAGFACSTVAHAQKPALSADQNPRYRETRAKYIKLSDSLTRDQGTTVQNTYKAYDWYTAREERRQLRREGNANDTWYNPYGYGSAYFYPSAGYSIGLGLGFGYGNYGFGSWGHHRYRNRW